MKHYRKPLLFTAVLFACLLFASCAQVTSVRECLSGEPYGFLHGILHGFITPVSFIAKLFGDDTAIYAVNNTGNWYDFGFLLGSSGWGFLAGNRSRR